jgi:hypothetical protein
LRSGEGGPQESEGCHKAECGSHRVKRAPTPDHGPALGTSRDRLSRHEPVVRGHDGKERYRPVGDHQQRPQGPADVSGLLPCRDPEQEAHDCQRSLHGETMLIGRLPLGQQGAVVELKTGGLLGNVDV